MPKGREHVSSYARGDYLDVGGEELTPKFANIAVGTSGDNTLVSAVASKKIRVISAFLVAASDVTAYFVDGNDTALAGDSSNGITMTGSSGFTLNENRFGWFQTGSGQSLDLNLSGNVAVGGSLTYVEI